MVMREYSYSEKKCPGKELFPHSCKCYIDNDYHPICINQSLIQLYDRNLINDLTDSRRFLTLSNSNPIQSTSTNIDVVNNQSFSTGGYTISTTNVKNDTLNLPGPGIYRISISFESTFAPDEIIIIPESSVTLVYNLLDGNSISISVIKSNTSHMIDYDMAITNAEVLYKSNEIQPSLRILLSDFNFDASLNNKLTVSNLILIVQKLQNL